MCLLYQTVVLKICRVVTDCSSKVHLQFKRECHLLILKFPSLLSFSIIEPEIWEIILLVTELAWGRFFGLSTNSNRSMLVLGTRIYSFIEWDELYWWFWDYTLALTCLDRRDDRGSEEKRYDDETCNLTYHTGRCLDFGSLVLCFYSMPLSRIINNIRQIAIGTLIDIGNNLSFVRYAAGYLFQKGTSWFEKRFKRNVYTLIWRAFSHHDNCSLGKVPSSCYSV